MSSAKVTHEINLTKNDAPAIDISLFKPTEVELEFLRHSISQDDEELKRSVFKAQEE